MSFLSRVLCEDNAACRSRFPLVLRKRRARAAGRRRGPYGEHEREIDEGSATSSRAKAAGRDRSGSHGSPSKNKVEWSHAANGQLVLRWTETDGPPVKPPTHRGFGTRVIEHLIKGQLNGQIRFDWRAEGLICEVTIKA
jgi:hypothetical protein